MRDQDPIRSIPDVCEVTRAGPAGRPASYLIELPHGATRAAHFEALRGALIGDFPEDLEAFYFVNTDVGTPECAIEVARGLARTGASTLIVRALLPRTFIDCNRVIEGGLRGQEMTPPVPEYVRHRDDIQTLVRLYGEYQEVARRAYEEVCRNGGLALNLHSFAPRSVKIGRIDEGIVQKLREAYAPGRLESWERRPQIDIISEDADGRRLASSDLVADLKRAYAAIGIDAVENETYRLHAETMTHVHSSAHPGKVLCMEINRELLADPFDPFVEMRIAPQKAARMAAPLVAALRGNR
jgi:hypothetical protein